MAEAMRIFAPNRTTTRVADFLPARYLPDGRAGHRAAVLRALGVDLDDADHACALCGIPLHTRDGLDDFFSLVCSFQDPGAWVGLVVVGLCPACVDQHPKEWIGHQVRMRAIAAIGRN